MANNDQNNNKNGKGRNNLRGILTLVAWALVLTVGFNYLNAYNRNATNKSTSHEIKYSEMLALIENDKAEEVLFKDDAIYITPVEGYTYTEEQDEDSNVPAKSYTQSKDTKLTLYTAYLNDTSLLPLLKESRPVLIICMVRFVQNIATGLGVGTYYWQYIIGNLGMMGVASVTTILVLPLAFALPGLRKKFGMAGMSVIGILVGCIGYLATFFAGGNMVFFIVATLLVSAGAVPLNMMFNMFIADVADYNEWKGFKRMEGTMGSLTGLSGKLGSAFGGFLMGVLMSASGYVGGAAVQADSAIMMIRVLASVVPLVLMLVVAAILRFYTVDKQMPQIKQDLEARAAATTEAAAE